MPSRNVIASRPSSLRLRWLLARFGGHVAWQQLKIEIQALTGEIQGIGNEDGLWRGLCQIPGFGPWSRTRLGRLRPRYNHSS